MISIRLTVCDLQLKVITVEKCWPSKLRPRSVFMTLKWCKSGNLMFQMIYIRVTNTSVYNQWYYAGIGSSNFGVLLADMSNDGVVTVDSGGGVRVWETAVFNLSRSLRQWRNMIGENDNRPLQVRWVGQNVFRNSFPIARLLFISSYLTLQTCWHGYGFWKEVKISFYGHEYVFQKWFAILELC